MPGGNVIFLLLLFADVIKIKKPLFFSCFWILFTAKPLHAEETAGNELHTPTSASPIITVFAGHHSGIGRHNEKSGFELTRAYAGYQFKLSPTLSGKVIVDAAAPSSDGSPSRVLLKNALLCRQHKRWTLNAGMIPLLQFKYQETAWGNRYIEDSHQSINGMGPSADLGATFQYRISSQVSADLSLTNGEGYKNISHDNDYRYAAGLTLTPIAGFTFRTYYDLYTHGDATGQQTVSLFAHYQCDALSLGAEYNYQINHRFLNGHDLFGSSVYATLPLTKRWRLLGRYDYLNSKGSNPQDGHTALHHKVIIGAGHHPVKQLRISPNYRYLYTPTTGAQHEIYLNIGFFL
jgi:hypothetical protein